LPEPYYADETVTLYRGDCREILPALDLRADCILTDPPYESTSLAWDRWPDGWLEVVARVANSMWVFLPLRQFAEPPYRGQEFRAAGWRLSHDVEPDLEFDHDHLTWEKHNGSGFAKDRFKGVHEPVSHWYRGAWGDVYRDTPRVPRTGPAKSVKNRTSTPHTGAISGGVYVDDGTRLARSVIRVRSMHGRAIHHTEKPVQLLDYLIRYACPPSGVVLDPMAGSGSTGEAARLAGRRAVLIEADAEHCARIAERFANDLLSGLT
jgi:site-specific DNA-methyltransferase (adenine-specific)